MNHMVCIIDRSGSMQAMKEDALGGFNSFLDQQKKEDTKGKDKLTYVHFDHEYEKLLDRVKVKEVEPLTPSTYQPRGSTALLDAIGKTISELTVKKNDTTIVCIITDGHENSSKEYTKDSVKKLIEEKQEEGWKFVFACADLEAMDDAINLGIPPSQVFATANTKAGTRERYSSTASLVSNCKS